MCDGSHQPSEGSHDDPDREHRGEHRGCRQSPGAGGCLARELRVSPERARHRGSSGAVRHRELLARPGLVHLEHHDRRGPGRGLRAAHRDAGEHRPVRVRDRGAAGRGRRCGHGVDHLRDRCGSGPRAAAAQGGGRRGPSVDTADHALRAQGLRGAAAGPQADGGRARSQQGAADLARAPAAGGGDASAAPPSPTSSSSAVARPASVSAPDCDSWASRAWSSTSTAGQATSGAAATSPCACTTRSGTTTCPT